MDGKLVKKMREWAGLTQREAAKCLGWTAQRWSDMENDRHPNPRVGTMLAVCKVIQCQVADVLRKS